MIPDQTPAPDVLLSAHPADERVLLDEQIAVITAMLALLASAPKADAKVPA